MLVTLTLLIYKDLFPLAKKKRRKKNLKTTITAISSILENQSVRPEDLPSKIDFHSNDHTTLVSHIFWISP